MTEISNFLYNLARGLASHLAFLFIVQYFVRQFSHCAINSFCPNCCVVLVTWVIWKYEQGGVQSSQTTSDVTCYHRNSSGQYKMQTADGEFKLFFRLICILHLISDCHAIAFRHYLSRSFALLWNIPFVLF